MLRAVLRLLFGATRSTGIGRSSMPSPLHIVIREHPADVTEAECDRYTRYHNTNQHGR